MRPATIVSALACMTVGNLIGITARYGVQLLIYRSTGWWFPQWVGLVFAAVLALAASALVGRAVVRYSWAGECWKGGLVALAFNVAASVAVYIAVLAAGRAGSSPPVEGLVVPAALALGLWVTRPIPALNESMSSTN